MADRDQQDASGDFSFGVIRPAQQLGKENWTPLTAASRSTSGAAPKQSSSRVRFAPGVFDKDSPSKVEQHSPRQSRSASSTTNRGNSRQQSGTVFSTPAGKSLPVTAAAPEQATPTDAAGLPTPIGTVGRAAVPPTPFMPQSTVISAQSLGWRNRAYNATFKGRSPSSSRQSSPASSSGLPDFGTPSHSQSFMDMLSPMATPSTASSPLYTPGGRALGRGLDESPCISGSTSRSYSSRGHAKSKPNEETPAHAVQANTAEGAFASPISTSEEISSQKTDHSPAAVSHHSASSLPHTSSTEAPLPFGSPSAPSTCSPGTAHTALPEQIASEDTLSQHNADPEELTAHAVVAEPASPSLCETAAAALLLDLSAAPAPLQTNINVLPAECAADEQAVEATASVLPVQIDNVHDQALPQAAATFGIDEVQALHCAEAEQAHVQTADAASESIQPGAQESSSPASQQPAMVVMPVDEAGRAPRTSTTRPQSAPSTLHQQPLPSVDLDELADRANSSTPLRSQSEEPQQVSTSAPLYGLPEEACTPLPNRRVAALSGASLPFTPVTQGTKEYGSWWTPRLPKALTPAWLKARTPSWLSKSQGEEPLQPMPLNLVSLSPFLKPASQPSMTLEAAQPNKELQPDKSGRQLLVSVLLSLTILVGTVWGSYHSTTTLPMMHLYHAQQNYDWHSTAPYMWAGSLSDALQQSAAAVGLSTSSAASHLQSPDSYLTQEEVHAAFEQARRRKPDTVDARYALNRPPRQLSSSQHEDAPHLPTSAELEQPSSDDEQADLPSASSVDSYPLSDGGAAEPSTRPDSEYKQDLLSSAPDVDTPLTGSGASFAMPGDKLAWFTKLQHVWTDIMAYVHAAQQPIRFFSARPLPDNHLYCEEDDAPCAEQLQETDMAPHGFAYSPWPQPSAVKEAWQQASSQIRLQLAAAAAHLSTAQAAVSETVRHHASSAGSVVRYAQEWGKGTIKQPLQALQKSEPGVSQDVIESVSQASGSDGLASASASLMDTLDELLDSLTTESADAEQQSEADLSYIDETAPEDILQHHDTAPHDGSGDAIEANPAFQVEGIEGDAQTELETADWHHRGGAWANPQAAEQDAPYTAEPVGDQPSLEVLGTTTDPVPSWGALQQAALPLACLAAATAGLALLIRLLYGAPAIDDEDAESDDVVPAEQQYTTPDRPTRSSLYSTPPPSSVAGSIAASSIAAQSPSALASPSLRGSILKSPLATALSPALLGSARNSPAMSSPAGLGYAPGSPGLDRSPVASASRHLTRSIARSVSKLAAQSSPAIADSAIADSATAPCRYNLRRGSRCTTGQVSPQMLRQGEVNSQAPVRRTTRHR